MAKFIKSVKDLISSDDEEFIYDKDNFSERESDEIDETVETFSEEEIVEEPEEEEEIEESVEEELEEAIDEEELEEFLEEDDDEIEESVEEDEDEIEESIEEDEEEIEESVEEEEIEESMDEEDEEIEDPYMIEDLDDIEAFDHWEASGKQADRRKRRVRNQMISYIVVLLVLVGVGVSLFAGGKYLLRSVQPPEKEEQIEEQLQALSQAEEEIVIEAPSEEVEEEPEDYLAELIENCISEMPLEDKVAQLFLVTPETLTGVKTVTQAGEGTKTALSEYAVGGLVYSEKNMQSKDQFSEMLVNTRNASKYPMFFAVEESCGGQGAVAKSAIDVEETKTQLALGEEGNRENIHETATVIGGYLQELGINLNLSVSAEVVADADTSVMEEASFGAEFSSVEQMVSSYLQGFEEKQIYTCVKFLPGISACETDTSEERVELEKSLDQIITEEIPLFKKAVEAGADMIMVSAVTFTGADDSNLPACMSRNIMNDIIRKEMEYEGVIITDVLNQHGLTEYYLTDEVCVRAIQAGADLLYQPDDLKAGHEAIMNAIAEGKITEERINDSLRRIYRLKYADKIN